MNLAKAQSRDRKRNKSRLGMQVDGRSIFILQETQRERDLRIKREREEKQKLLELGQET